MYDQIIILSLDNLRSDCLGLTPQPLWPQQYGSQRPPRTDALTALASRGTFFPNCISNAPYASASYATILTGKWARNHGVLEDFNHKLDSPTLFSLARDCGYRTIFKADSTDATAAPFLGLDQHVDDYINGDDATFLDALHRWPRSFSMVRFSGLNVPYGFHNLRDGGEAYRDRVEAMERDLPKLDGLPDEQPTDVSRSGADLDLFLRYKRIIRHHYLNKNYDLLFQLYLDGVEFFLQNRFQPFIDRLLELLGNRRFLLVIVSNHGEEYDANSFGHRNSLSDGALHAPFILYGDDIPSAVHATPMRSADIAPTLASLVDLKSQKPLDYDGVSLASTVSKRAPYPTRPAVAQTYGGNVAASAQGVTRDTASDERSESPRPTADMEAVYDGNFKLLRQTCELDEHGRRRELDQPRLTLSLRQADGRRRPSSNVSMQRKLESLLDTYNRIGKLEAPSNNIPDHLREALQDFGYKV